VPLAASTLACVTGGLAVGRIHADDRLDPSFEGAKTKAGWTIGAGLEQRWTQNVSLKLEYLYMDFGRDEYFQITNRTPERVDLDVHTVRIGLSYSFSGPEPAPYRPLK
jgi:outer membrane immunogenic protein